MRAAAFLLLLILPAVAGADDDVTVYRCEDARGRVTLQDAPCPDGQAGTRRSMVRPKDPPPRPVAPASVPPTDDAAQAMPAPPYAPPPVLPPPPMFQCTDYDGAVRFSEEYAPSTRCVPLAVLGYRGDAAATAATCRWVQESCLRLDDGQACRQFREKLQRARSDALHAFSDTAAFRKSEAERLRRIVDESCR